MDVIKPFIVDEVLRMQFVHWFALYTGLPSIFLSEVFETGLKNDTQCIWTRIAFNGELQRRVTRISERINFTPNKTKEVSLQKIHRSILGKWTCLDRSQHFNGFDIRLNDYCEFNHDALFRFFSSFSTFVTTYKHVFTHKLKGVNHKNFYW